MLSEPDVSNPVLSAIFIMQHDRCVRSTGRCAARVLRCVEPVQSVASQVYGNIENGAWGFALLAARTREPIQSNRAVTEEGNAVRLE